MSTWQPLADAIARYADIDRPVVRCVVTDVTLWAATGPAYVGLLLPNGSQTQAIYRDQPAPSVGQVVSAVRMSADPHSLWLVLPAPNPTATLVACSYDGNVGTQNGGPGLDPTDPYFFAVLARHADGTWEKRAPHPFTHAIANAAVFTSVTNGFDAYFSVVCPLRRSPSGRLFTYGAVLRDFAVSDSAGHVMDPTTPCWFSNDQGATWQTVTGLTAPRNIDTLADGTLIAAAHEGDWLVRSTDDGDTWTTVAGSACPTDKPWHTVVADPVDAGTVALANYDGCWVATGLPGAWSLAGPMGPPDHSTATSPPDGYPLGNWPARAPSGAATVARPDRLDTGFIRRPDFMRQPDPFPSTGAIMPIVYTNNTWYGFQHSRFWIVGSTLYRCEIDQGFRSGGAGSDPGPDGPSAFIWQSDDDGATWTRFLTAYDPVLLGPQGQLWATGIGQIAEAADGSLYANTDSTDTGPSWYTDPFDSATHSYSPGARLLRYAGGTWSDATGSLIADTDDAGAWYCLYGGGWVLL